MEEKSGNGSECQSGWSAYLWPSSLLCMSRDSQEEEGEEDEGLSMVSDASSGPEQFHEKVQKDCGKRRRTEMDYSARKKDNLDDTASSPLSHASINISDDTARSACSDVEVSSEFSATYLKGWGKLWKPFSYNEDKPALGSAGVEG